MCAPVPSTWELNSLCQTDVYLPSTYSRFIKSLVCMYSMHMLIIKHIWILRIYALAFIMHIFNTWACALNDLTSCCSLCPHCYVIVPIDAFLC